MLLLFLYNKTQNLSSSWLFEFVQIHEKQNAKSSMAIFLRQNKHTIMNYRSLPLSLCVTSSSNILVNAMLVKPACWSASSIAFMYLPLWILCWKLNSMVYVQLAHTHMHTWNTLNITNNMKRNIKRMSNKASHSTSAPRWKKLHVVLIFDRHAIQVKTRYAFQVRLYAPLFITQSKKTI